MAGSRRGRFSRRRYFHCGVRCRCSLLLDAESPFRACGKGCPGCAAMACCSCRERQRRRRRSFLRNHLTVHYRCRRRGYVIRGGGLRAQYSFARRIHRYSCTDRSGSQLFGIHRHSRFCDRLCAGESTLRNCRHRALHVPVGVGNVGNVGGLVHDRRVVDVRNGCVVDGGVADVDAFDICHGSLDSTVHRLREDRAGTIQCCRPNRRRRPRIQPAPEHTSHASSRGPATQPHRPSTLTQRP